MIKKNKLEEYCNIATNIALSSGKFLQQISLNEKRILPKDILLEESPVTEYDKITGDVA